MTAPAITVEPEKHDPEDVPLLVDHGQPEISVGTSISSFEGC